MWNRDKKDAQYKTGIFEKGKKLNGTENTFKDTTEENFPVMTGFLNMKLNLHGIWPTKL